MNKKRLGLYFIASLIVGLMLSACAGYASSQFTTDQPTLMGGPTIQTWQVSWLEAERADTQLVAVHKSFTAYQSAERVQNLIQGYGQLCNKP